MKIAPLKPIQNSKKAFVSRRILSEEERKSRLSPLEIIDTYNDIHNDEEFIKKHIQLKINDEDLGIASLKTDNPLTEPEDPHFNESSRVLEVQDKTYRKRDSRRIALEQSIANLRKLTVSSMTQDLNKLNRKATVLSHLVPFMLFALIRLLYYATNLRVTCRVDQREGNTITGTKKVCDSEEEYIGVVISTYCFVCGPILYNFYINLWDYLSPRFFLVLYGLITPTITLLTGYANYWLTNSLHNSWWNIGHFGLQFGIAFVMCRRLELPYIKVIAPFFVIIALLLVWFFCLFGIPLLFESDQNSTLLLFPLFLTILNVVIINLIELIKPLDQFSQQQIQFFCATYTVVIDTSRFALFLFTRKTTSQYFTTMCFGLSLSALFEIITRTAIDDVIKCWVLNQCASCFYRRNSDQKVWVLKGRNRITRIFYGTRYSIPYYPIGIMIVLQLLGWVPYYGRGNHLNEYGKIDPIYSIPWYFHTIFLLTELISDIGTFFISKKLKFAQIKMVNFESFWKKLAQNLTIFVLGLVFIFTYGAVFYEVGHEDKAANN